MKIFFILGTRPEIIKLSSIIRLCQQRSVDFSVIHTNQHYSSNMDEIFFQELDLPVANYNLNIKSSRHGEMTGSMLDKIEKILLEEKPDIVVVQGDTNTVLAGALAASKIPLKIAHVEAGLRSYDRSMPEEINRIVTDHISDHLFCPTDQQANILTNEGIDSQKIHIVGNTIVDAVYQCSKIAKIKSTILQQNNIQPEEYILVTCHRPATVDVRQNLKLFFEILNELTIKYQKKIVFPIHPRTAKMCQQFGLENTNPNIILLPPIGFLDMLQLESNSFFILTDSGGLQEEACILQKKCVIYRENTERPEVLSNGGAILVGNNDKTKILSGIDDLLSRQIVWNNPFGDGRTGEKILDILCK